MARKWQITGLMVATVMLGGIFAYSQGPKMKVPRSFAELIELSEQELELVDIARMNLLCAKGLPGSEELDVEQYMETLDTWAGHVLEMERRYTPVFHRNRLKYGNSMALFKGVYLGIAIEQDFNCGY